MAIFFKNTLIAVSTIAAYLLRSSKCFLFIFIQCSGQFSFSLSFVLRVAFHMHLSLKIFSVQDIFKCSSFADMCNTSCQVLLFYSDPGFGNTGCIHCFFLCWLPCCSAGPTCSDALAVPCRFMDVLALQSPLP